MDNRELLYVKYIGYDMNGISLLCFPNEWYASTTSPEKLDTIIR